MECTPRRQHLPWVHISCQKKPLEPEWDEVFQVQRCKVGWATGPQARDSREQQLLPAIPAMKRNVFISIYSSCQRLPLKGLGAEHICPRQKGRQEPCQPRLRAAQPRHRGLASLRPPPARVTKRFQRRFRGGEFDKLAHIFK